MKVRIQPFRPGLYASPLSKMTEKTPLPISFSNNSAIDFYEALVGDIQDGIFEHLSHYESLNTKKPKELLVNVSKLYENLWSLGEMP
jgi:hypothetical protein